MIVYIYGSQIKCASTIYGEADIKLDKREQDELRVLGLYLPVYGVPFICVFLGLPRCNLPRSAKSLKVLVIGVYDTGVTLTSSDQ